MLWLGARVGALPAILKKQAWRRRRRRRGAPLVLLYDTTTTTTTRQKPMRLVPASYQGSRSPLAELRRGVLGWLRLSRHLGGGLPSPLASTTAAAGAAAGRCTEI